MRFLVTGAAGFIGSHVAERLLSNGHEVVGCDDLNDAYDPRLKEWRLARLANRDRFRFVRADIRDRAAAESLFSAGPYSAVINLAARAGVRQSLEDPWIYHETNVVGTLNVLEACRRHGVARMLLASTSSLYGKVNPLPFREDANTDRPLSPYAASKKAAEALCASYAHLYGLDLTTLRFFTVYGPAGRPDMSVFRFIRWVAEGERVKMYGDGSQRRDFTHVDDIARGVVAAVEAPLSGYEVVNLGSDRPVQLRAMLAMVEEELGRKADLEVSPAHAADVTATWADIGRARRLLGWEPKVDLREGLRSAVRWYRENRDWARRLSLEPSPRVPGGA